MTSASSSQAGPAAGRLRPSPLEWLCLAVGVFLTLRYAWVLDDAFVYLRYADNWVGLGNGLVYNRGEFVEGFTSPAWMLLVGAFDALGWDYWLVVRVVGVASFALFWWWLVVLNRELSPADAPVVNAPLVFLSFNYAVACYFTSGVEAPLVQVAAAAYALFLVRPERRAPGAVVALSPLVRPELALTFGLALAWTGWRTRRWRPVLALALAGGVATGGWLLFRVWYYADLLPNTFYLKNLVDPAQGRIYLMQTLDTYGVVPLAAGFALLAALLRWRRVAIDGWARLAMLALAAAVAAYVVRIGGDPRHHRYLVFPFCLGVAASAGLVEQGLRAFAPRWCGRPAARRTRLAVVAGVWTLGLALGLFSGSRVPPQLAGHPLLRPVAHHRVDGINDAHFHRVHRDLAAWPWTLEPRFDHREALEDWRDGRDGPGGTPGHPAYREVIAEGWCYTAWERFDDRVVHLAGLTDALLARVEMDPDRPGHKFGLFPMARELAALYEDYPPGPGALRRAVEDGRAPAWVADNLDTIEVVERKVYNRHHLGENLRLAFAFPPRIQP